MFLTVSGQLLPKKIDPPVQCQVLGRVKVRFRVVGNCPRTVPKGPSNIVDSYSQGNQFVSASEQTKLRGLNGNAFNLLVFNVNSMIKLFFKGKKCGILIDLTIFRNQKSCKTKNIFSTTHPTIPGDCIYICIFFFYRYISTHTFKNMKTLSPGTNILGVPGKKHKKKFLIKKLTKNN